MSPSDRTIHLIHGSDARAMAIALLEARGVADRIPSGASVGLKPNLVVARPASGGATTHPEMVKGVIEYLQSHGIRDITIMEGSWVGDSTRRAYKRCGYEDLAQKYGVGLIDLKQDEVRTVDTPAGPVNVCARALDVDVLINLPVLKGHCQTVMTCALKNLKGCIPDSEKRRFHSMGLHKPIAGLATALKTAFTLVDSICGDPGFEEGGSPEQTDRMYLGEDPVQLDVFGCELLGIPPSRVPYIGLAEEFGAGSGFVDEADLVEIDLSGQPIHEVKVRVTGSGSTHVNLTDLADVREDQACSACAAALTHALLELEKQGADLSRLPPLSIGQGFRDRSVEGVGIGRCTARSGQKSGVYGCPPTPEAIIGVLRGFIE